jgi:hypothetical protein
MKHLISVSIKPAPARTSGHKGRVSASSGVERAWVRATTAPELSSRLRNYAGPTWPQSNVTSLSQNRNFTQVARCCMLRAQQPRISLEGEMRYHRLDNFLVLFVGSVVYAQT